MRLGRILPFATLTLFILMGASSAASIARAESALHTQVIPITLWTRGPVPGITSNTGCKGFMTPGTQVSVSYNVRALNPGTGEPVCGATIPVGTEIKFEFLPHTSADVAWYGSGYYAGTPNGDWATNNDFSPWDSGSKNRCLRQNYFDTIKNAHGGYDYLYAALAVATPDKDVVTTGSVLSCATPASDGSVSCTAAQAGSLEAQFRFDATFGKFYPAIAAGSASSPPATDLVTNRCSGWNSAKPMYQFKNITNENATTQWTACGGSGEYRLSVPAQTISCPITVLPPDPTATPPSTPTLTSSGACIVGTPHSISFVSTDPDNDNVRYGIDWDADGSVNEWVPPTGHVASGQSQSASRTYSIAGSKTVKVMAQDEGGLASDWATLTFTCSETPLPPVAHPPATGQCSDNSDNDNDGLIDSLDPDCTATSGFSEWPPENNPPAGNPPGGSGTNPAAILDLRVIPSLVKSGNTTKVNWSAQNVESCNVTAQNGDSWTGTASPLGGRTSSPITGETTYTLACTDLDGDSQTKTAKVRILPGFREL